MTATDRAIASHLAYQTDASVQTDSVVPNWICIALVAASTTLPMLLAQRTLDAYGVTVEQPTGSSGQVATIHVHAGASIVGALESLADHLRKNQMDLDPADKEILYRNLWELYD